jgi:microcystin-dependent protein
LIDLESKQRIMFSHTHTYLDRGNDTTSDGKYPNNGVRVNPYQQPNANRTTDPTGGDQPHENIPPYIAIEDWYDFYHFYNCFICVHLYKA